MTPAAFCMLPVQPFDRAGPRSGFLAVLSSVFRSADHLEWNFRFQHYESNVG